MQHIYQRNDQTYAWVEIVHKYDSLHCSSFWRFYSIETWQGEVPLNRISVDGQILTEEYYQQLIEEGQMARPTPDLINLIDVMQQKHEHIKRCTHKHVKEIDSGYPVPPRNYTRVQCQDCGRKLWRAIQEKTEEKNG